MIRVPHPMAQHGAGQASKIRLKFRVLSQVFKLTFALVIKQHRRQIGDT
ncbi:hypothetical protein [Tropicibacter sp. Alg240-R139]|nr:hypothetical protein [Tropicibacter sp. Alg240-R139]